jgi:hypothetical protein
MRNLSTILASTVSMKPNDLYPTYIQRGSHAVVSVAHKKLFS